MKTKLHIIISGESHGIDPTDIKNWDEISFTLERKDFSGVMRSFSSQFQFVGTAFTLLRDLYLSDGFLAVAEVAVSTKNNDWTYTEQFRCPLDFSTLEIENETLTINAVDNTLAALLKSKKGQKYEFPMGQFATSYVTVQRMAFANSAHFTLPNPYNAAGIVDARKDDGASTVISTEYVEPYDASSGYDGTPENRFFAKINTPPSPLIQIWVRARVRCYLNPSGDYHPLLDGETAVMSCVYGTEGTTTTQLVTNLFNNDITTQRINGSIKNMWIGGLNHRNYATLEALKEAAASHVYGLYPGMFGVVGNYSYGTDSYWTGNTVYEYGVNGQWVAMGAPAFYYQDRVLDGTASVENLGSDQYLMLRLDHAMEFTDATMTMTWTDPARQSYSYNAIRPIQLLQSIVQSISPTATASIAADAAGLLAKTYVIPAETLRKMSGANAYSTFQQFAEWMEAVFGYTYRVVGNEVQFVHRSEVFDGSSVKVIDNVREVKYSVNDGIIYSEVDAGYSKKEYGEINGRLEKNFTNYYATDYNATDKKLSLISKYRTDAYGIEFTLRKGEKQSETTDDKTDEDVFVLCAEVESGTLTYRAAKNAAYLPSVCVANNAAYIAAMGNGKSVTLTMTSSDGDNALNDVTIAANTALFTAGKLSFTTDDMTLPEDWDGLIQVDHGGYRLRGFISKAEARFGRPAGMEYELIISDITEL
ncbi:MAG: hypothetical protein IJS04_04105 [Muribaculaceae bacterium]|nr:hypothetical protein [Muribaculaceae bacterium]